MGRVPSSDDEKAVGLLARYVKSGAFGPRRPRSSSSRGRWGASTRGAGSYPIVNIWVAANIADELADHDREWSAGFVLIRLFIPVLWIGAWVKWGGLWGSISTSTDQERGLGWVVGIPLVGALASWVIALRMDGTKFAGLNPYLVQRPAPPLPPSS